MTVRFKCAQNHEVIDWITNMKSDAESSSSQASHPKDETISLRRRLAHAAWSAAAIAALGWWSWYSDPDPSLPEVIASAADFEGRQVKISDEPVVESVATDSFIVRSRGFRLRVSGRVSTDDVGRFVYVRGIFRRPAASAEWDGIINPAEHHVARGRRAKIWLSVIPVVWITVLLLRHFRIDTTRWSIEPRA